MKKKMEKGEKTYIVSLPFKSISWSTQLTKKFRIRVTSIQPPKDGEITPEVEFDFSPLKENQSTFSPQPEKGIPYSEDYLMFKCVSLVDLLGLKIEFHFADEEKPKASSFLLFEDVSPGYGQVPIVDSNLNVLGQTKVRYLIIKPYPYEMSQELCPILNDFLKKGIHVGHRGAGVSRRLDLSDNIIENTILSLNHAAKHGADMVEFDVHLTKDDVPILYHDFSVLVSLTKKDSKDYETLELPVKDLTYQQLKILKLEPKRDDKTFYFCEDDSEGNQPFCKLEHALNVVSPCAFNVEIKYPTGSGIYKDLNHFVDTVLKTLFDHHNNRTIIISSFDPDICAMAKLKQKRFPVLFLTDDINEEEPATLDDRMFSVEMACYYSLAMSFSGVNCYAQNLITNKSLVAYVIKKGLLLFCYGNSINTSSIVEDLISEGVHGVIYDRIDVISPKKLLSSAASANPISGDIKLPSPPIVRKTSATIFSVDTSSN